MTKEQETLPGQLAKAFALEQEGRENYHNEIARSAFHTWLHRLDKALDGAMQSQMLNDSQGARYGFGNPQDADCLYVEIGPKEEGADARRITLVYRENGGERLKVTTKRSQIPGPVGAITFEKGRAEELIDLLRATEKTLFAEKQSPFARLEM